MSETDNERPRKTPRRRGDIVVPPPLYPIAVIGASTGGPGTLTTILSELPRDLPVSIVVVQHMPKDQIGALVQNLKPKLALPVEIAADGMEIRPQQVYLAPGGRDNLLVTRFLDRPPKFKVVVAPASQIYTPSVDALFKSAAELYQSSVIGLLLTGMGNDGTEGMRAIREQGGVTIAESEQSSVIFGMPKSAIDAGVVEMVLPKERIGAVIYGQVLTLCDRKRLRS